MNVKINNILGLATLVGALFLIFGVFATWATESGYDYSGALIHGEWGMYPDDVKYGFAPFICGICGIVTLALMILPAIIDFEDKKTKIMMVLGIISIALAALALLFTILLIKGGFYNDNGLKVGWGAYLCIVGSIIVIIGGVLPILQARGIIKI